MSCVLIMYICMVIEEGRPVWALLENFCRHDARLHRHGVLVSIIPMPNAVISTRLTLAK